MDDVHLELEDANGLECSSTEENETFAIVAIVDAPFTVKMISVEVIVLLDEIDGHVRTGQLGHQQTARDSSVADGHFKLQIQFRESEVPLSRMQR